MRTYTTQIQPGWTVIDRFRDKIGDVTDVQPEYVMVTKGLVFLHDVYIPWDAIGSVDLTDQTVVLNVDKSQIDPAKWSQAPAAGSLRTDLAGALSARMRSSSPRMKATRSRTRSKATIVE